MFAGGAVGCGGISSGPAEAEASKRLRRQNLFMVEILS